MDYKKVLKSLSNQNHGIITIQVAQDAGISRAMMSKLCKAGTIQRMAMGQYILADDMADELLSIHLRTEHLFFMKLHSTYMGSRIEHPSSIALRLLRIGCHHRHFERSVKCTIIKLGWSQLGLTTMSVIVYLESGRADPQ